ncbi:calexcitin-2-like isoform X2 [Dreissena polymorpha]|nr:calexcitin-2-like isoform X2 [Dreissena polymorpha]
MGLVLGIFKPELSEFQKKKLLYEFSTFFDLNKDGTLEWHDFEMARQKICDMSGWQVGSPRYLHTHELFKEIWRKLQDDGDENFDGKISKEEWIKMWQTFHKQHLEQLKKRKDDVTTEPSLPVWLEKYIEYKFNLLDRTGNGFVDVEEYEYVMAEFGIPPKQARNAFTMFSVNNDRKVDMEYFRHLCTEYYRSDDPSSLGNFINGKLDFTD